jgi:diguanylate cyclase (GGDEF)-like protein
MRIPDATDRRANQCRDLTDTVAFPGVVSRAKAWLIILPALGLTGLADAATGYDLWFGPFYLAAIGISAWMLGRWEAVGVGLAALAIIVLANGFHLYPYGTSAALWNLAMRIVTVLMFIGLLDRVRNSYAREWRLARTDPLTGALNRQAFFELAAATSISKGWTMIAYADLDGLKKFNDERGHAAGDQCLKAYVQHVRTVIRKHDHFARLGGDEFILHLRVRDEPSARAVGERLHREMNAVAEDVHPDLKCSVGVLILPPGRRMLDQEVLAADQLMYEAKSQGAGLAVATLREVRGTQYILQHANTDGFASNGVLNDHLNSLADRDLDAAA